jgi:predicted CoA-substrate-specific enzyme activase
MLLVAGIDCGSGFTKAVILAAGVPDTGPRLMASARVRSGVEMDAAANAALAEALAACGRTRIDYLAATGFGRYNVAARDIQITEITSAACGAAFLVPHTECVLDIGAQSTRAVAVRDRGKVRNFKTNDKCAAGSGMFIVRAAKYLEVEVERVGALSLAATNPQPISSVCAVLAESEIINHVSSGVSVDDILRGIHDSLADRAGTLLRRVGLREQVTVIGGVARQAGLIAALGQRLGVRVDVPEQCEYACALGAALLGLRRYERLQASAATALGSPVTTCDLPQPCASDRQ